MENKICKQIIMLKKYILYGAYGSNLNKEQMKKRCPSSRPFMSIELVNWELVFKGVADIIPSKGEKVFLGVYKITDECEYSLDKYEEYPEVYNKHYLEYKIKYKKVKILTYIMVDKYKIGSPNIDYLNTIKKGYDNWNFNCNRLYNAAKYSLENNTIECYDSNTWSKSEKIKQENINNILFDLK